jgi:hypothetical protein
MVTINASTTSGLVMTSDLSGTLSLQSNGVAVTMPAVAGTMMVSGNMPAFSAYASSAQSLTANTATKLLFDTEEYDTNNNFATSRFTPTVAGYYQLIAYFQIAATRTGLNLYVYKNSGTLIRYIGCDNSANMAGLGGTGLFYANGSTDYFEIYGTSAATQNTSAGIGTVYFSGSMVRAA